MVLDYYLHLPRTDCASRICPLMLYLALPLGTTHGWGVCGRMIARELARIGPVELYTNVLHPQLIEDELEEVVIRELLPKGADPMNPPLA